MCTAYWRGELSDVKFVYQLDGKARFNIFRSWTFLQQPPGSPDSAPLGKFIRGLHVFVYHPLTCCLCRSRPHLAKTSSLRSESAARSVAGTAHGEYIWRTASRYTIAIPTFSFSLLNLPTLKPTPTHHHHVAQPANLVAYIKPRGKAAD